MTRKAFAATIVAIIVSGLSFFALRADAEKAPLLTMYSSPYCGCCGKWLDHLKAEGFRVKAENRNDMALVKKEKRVPASVASCHTAIIEGYVVEGHVPAAAIERLLAERPDIVGLAVPGMPAGSPGMESPNPVAYDVLAMEYDGKTTVFMHVTPS
jgi:hypothetical protein